MWWALVMGEDLTIRTERVDDVPLLLAQMERMGMPALLDARFLPAAIARA